MRISSPAFEAEGRIPAEYTCEGDDINPEIRIEEVPEDTESLVMILDDPDAPSKTWLHWLVYDIPPGKSVIAEDSVPGTEGTNDFDRRSYGGPCPPSGEHRYYFRVYALDARLDLGEGSFRSEVEKAMKGHVLDSGELMGKYSKA